MSDLLLDATTRGLTQALTLRHQRHEVLASNVANLETPGYRAREVDFKSALEGAFATTAARDPMAASPRVVEDPDARPRADGNTVDLDVHMAKLSDNAGRYTTLARILGLRLGMLRQAIEGSR